MLERFVKDETPDSLLKTLKELVQKWSSTPHEERAKIIQEGISDPNKCSNIADFVMYYRILVQREDFDESSIATADFSRMLFDSAIIFANITNAYELRSLGTELFAQCLKVAQAADVPQIILLSASYQAKLVIELEQPHFKILERMASFLTHLKNTHDPKDPSIINDVEMTISFITKLASSGPYCHGCYKPLTADTMNICTRCRVAEYCGRACQKAAWKVHKHRCGVMATQRKAEAASSENVSKIPGSKVEEIVEDLD